MELTDAQKELRERREAIVMEHIRCERKGTDIDGAVATFHEGHATYDVVPLRHVTPDPDGLTHPTTADVHQLLTELTTAFPDLELVPVLIHHADDAVIIEGRTQGTHQAPFMGIPPTGRSIDISASVIYRFEDDRMTNETIYFDLATQMRQLGFDTMEL